MTMTISDTEKRGLHVVTKLEEDDFSSLCHCCVSPVGSYDPPFGTEILIAVTFRASSEVERQKWVTALELAKAKAIQVTTVTMFC